MFDQDDMRLSRFPTLEKVRSFNDPPTADMIRSTRLYACTSDDIPAFPVAPPAMRTLFKILTDSRALAFIEKDQVLVTAKDVVTPAKMKKVAIEDLFPSFELPMVRKGICDFLLNEHFPAVDPMGAYQWSLEFLVEFDRILNIPVTNRNAVMMKNYNFRCLRHRISVKQLKPEDITYIKSTLPKYTPLLDMFQLYVFHPNV